MKQHQHDKIASSFICTASLLLSITSSSAIANEVYTWTDANGVVHYGDRPPDGQKAQVINVRETPGDRQPDPASEALITGDADKQETSPPQSAAEARREEIAKNRKERRETEAEMDLLCEKHRERLANVEPHRRVFSCCPMHSPRVPCSRDFILLFPV